MERGFKSTAEALAIELRKEMKLAAHAPLCAFALAKYLEVPLLRFSTLIPLALQTNSFNQTMADALEREVHGLTIPWRVGKAVLYNDNRAPARQQSDISHELAHILLGHPLTAMLPGAPTVLRNNELEDEAIHLGGALLMPRTAAIHVLRLGWSATVAAAHYGISEKLFQWRCNITGAKRR